MFFKVKRSVMIQALEKRVEDLKRELEGQTAAEEKVRLEAELVYHHAILKLTKDQLKPSCSLQTPLCLIQLLRPGSDWSFWRADYTSIVALMHHASHEFRQYMAACAAHFKEVPSA